MLLPNLFKTCALISILYSANATSNDLQNYTFDDMQCLFLTLNVDAKTRHNYYTLINDFRVWKKQHGKVYESAEHEVQRLLTWMDHHSYIEQHNKKDPAPSYTLGHNRFSDIPNSEFQKMHNLGAFAPDFGPLLESRTAKVQQLKQGSLLRGSHSDSEYENDLKGLPVQEVNWVEAGAVTPVKNQERCGSCWAFSATGAIEGANFVKNGQLIPLSEQILVDCDNVDQGCEGGIMDSAFEFDEAQKGLCSEDDYPYTANDDTCKSDQCNPVPGSAVKFYADIPEGSMHDLLKSIIIQPTSIAMQADQLAFQLYSGGVFDDIKCGETGMIDHGVLAVGFGHDDDTNLNYIMVKNSWGDTWGDGGYFKLKRHSKNEWGTCAILRVMSRPVVDKIGKDINEEFHINEQTEVS